MAASALRYYEELGLITAQRNSANQRRYEQSVLRRVAFIKAAQTVGLSLDEIADALAELPAGRTPDKHDWHRISTAWRPRLDEQIERLTRLRNNLDGCIGCGCLSLKSCALYNPDDALASRGTGGVLLEPTHDAS